MAASQNPTQGSLFGENEHIDINDAEKLNSSKTSNGNLSNQQLEEDASLRPRIKQTPKNPHQVIDIDVCLWDERLSTVGAFNLSSQLDINVSKREKNIDQNAAAFILQGAIDFLNN